MKKYIISFSILCVTLVSCEQDKVIFNESQTFVKFEETNKDVPIVIGSTASTEVPISVSSTSSSERSIPVEVVEDKTTVEAGTYTLGSITIPANSYEGKLDVNFVNGNGEFTEAKTLVVQIPSSADFSGAGELSFNVFEICPVDETLFVGEYYMEQTAPIPFLFGQSTLTHDTVVEVTANGLERSFDTFIFPFWCSTEVIPFKFNLVCNEIIVPVQDGNCGCGNEGYFAPAIIPATYSVDDDSVFELTFTGDATEACSASAGVQVTYRFTKQ
ncbi:hypothetical protein U6A24_21365 [Aquimarina gracilis]|uniref:Calx-beta domain-containing protein n=1 Tax=Aquimarina gracilis TaxID=874422 RepID=A0ABU6A1J8_9FLAO|nr:hypothetical protein [Aquimarina gracilis]MEB3348039.1 hypothetical protein [Aquimarina gracilis]